MMDARADRGAKPYAILLALLVGVLSGGCLRAVGADGGEGNDAGDGGDGGATNVCPPHNECTDDSQCPGGQYCDFKLALCPSGVGFAIVDGKCLPIVTQRPAECSVGEDCPPEDMCLDNYYQPCTTESPCDGGYCGFAPGPENGFCAPGCHHVNMPHYWNFPCICTGGNCCVAECPGDTYALCATLDRCGVPFNACQSALAAPCDLSWGGHPATALISCLGTSSCDVNACLTDAGLGPVPGFTAECLAGLTSLDRTYLHRDAAGGCGKAGWTCLIQGMCCSEICDFPSSGDVGTCILPDAGCIP